MQTREQMYRRAKQRAMIEIRNWIILAALTMVLIFGTIIIGLVTYANIAIENLMQYYQETITEIQTDYESQISTLNADIDEMNEYITSMNELVSQERSSDEKQFEILRKYWYVLRDCHDESGLTVEDLCYLDDLCYQYDLNPHLMWCIYDIESSYTAVIDNNNSSARGLGQVLNSTGKTIYENILGLGTYNHTMAYDVQINMQITVELIARNIDSGLYNAIAIYSGDSSGGYYEKLLRVANQHGIDLSDLSYQ